MVGTAGGKRGLTVHRKYDRANKARRYDAFVESDSSHESDDDQGPPPTLARENRKLPATELHEADVPRLVLPSPIVRQSVALGLVPAHLDVLLSLASA